MSYRFGHPVIHCAPKQWAGTTGGGQDWGTTIKRGGGGEFRGGGFMVMQYTYGGQDITQPQGIFPQEEKGKFKL